MKINPPPLEEVLSITRDFVSEILKESGARGFVMGASGGLDSSLLATLLKRCNMPFKALFLPDGEPNKDDERAISLLEDFLNIKVERYNIRPAKEVVLKDVLPEGEGTLVAGNLASRIRMCYLYTVANAEKLLVAGSSNKSEILLGYFTKWGDGAADIFPLGDLFKTQLYVLAKELKLPDFIIKRAPTAGLLPGQTDEGELGLSYDKIDIILRGTLLNMPVERIAEDAGTTAEEVLRIQEMVRRSRHKRMGLLIPKMGPETVGLDFHERW
ncbi:NAD(+) synthase [Thermoplasmatales archaeon ex4484_36]|nr:MAG: NAD(+) synthase [Thermoplasmatales archaeon ex4484_36]RLF56272.1 MAG: NAD(+) synthase [Thermoplasmata archaeon]HDD60211.1 NAD(+) synthase [Euryarchaeota archaeon]RLF70916.1 MAG: NAD(+) synthase [Thermoplasmata archaeon]RLF71401.1 MAG: NAD(+) synthase [Thermoplasmata archaeon]